MRDGVRERLCGGVCNPVTGDNQIFNTAIFKDDCTIDMEGAKFSPPIIPLVAQGKQNIEEMGRSVGRIYTDPSDVFSQPDLSVVFAIAPGLLLASRHASAFPYQAHYLSPKNQTIYRDEKKSPLRLEQLDIDYHYLDIIAQRHDSDPTGVHCGLVNFDIALFKIPDTITQNWAPLFPDIVIPSEKSLVGAIHYPSDQDFPEFKVYHRQEPQRNFTCTSENLLDVFQGVGTKNLSVGKRLIATRNPSNSVITYDLEMARGSAGAPLFRLDAPPNIFCGIHLGGATFLDHQWPAGWNYGYTVAGHHFVLMYLRYIIPIWKQSGTIPAEVCQYVRAHHHVINDHRYWLSIDGLSADWFLSL